MTVPGPTTARMTASWAALHSTRLRTSRIAGGDTIGDGGTSGLGIGSGSGAGSPGFGIGTGGCARPCKWMYMSSFSRLLRRINGSQRPNASVASGSANLTPPGLLRDGYDPFRAALRRAERPGIVQPADQEAGRPQAAYHLPRRVGPLAVDLHLGHATSRRPAHDQA